jgi:CheY-like chemotaxis protein
MEVLEEAGFEVIEARTADDAVLLLDHRPDIRLVFTDVDMPGVLDGFQLAQYVQDHHCDVAVIIGLESAALGRRRLALPLLAEAVFDVGLGQPCEAETVPSVCRAELVRSASFTRFTPLTALGEGLFVLSARLQRVDLRVPQGIRVRFGQTSLGPGAFKRLSL